MFVFHDFLLKTLRIFFTYFVVTLGIVTILVDMIMNPILLSSYILKNNQIFALICGKSCWPESTQRSKSAVKS